MSAVPNFQPQFGGVNVRTGNVIPFYFDFKGSPVARKIEEVLKAIKDQPNEEFENIMHEVIQANYCQSVEYKRRGRRRWLWGAYEEEPGEKVSIHIRGHYCSLSSIR